MKILLKFGLLICLLIVTNSHSITASAVSKPFANKGFIDLSGWDFDSPETLKLDGEWEFYWNVLLTPNDFKSTNQKKIAYISVPIFWNDYLLNGNPLPGTGYATFRLRIKLSQVNQIFAIKAPLMHSSYNLWANGKIILKNGKVGTSKGSTVHQYLPLSAPIEINDEKLELVLQIANFSHVNGGIWRSLRLGSASTIKAIEHRQIAYDVFLIGAIFIMGIYHFGLFAFRKSDLSPLAFGFFCLVISLRISLHGSTLILSLFPNANGEFLVKLDYFTIYFGSIGFLYFLKLLYPLNSSNRIFNIFLSLSVGFTIFTIITPSVVFTRYLEIFQAEVGIASLYMIYVMRNAIAEKKEGARMVFAGAMVILLAFINDVLYYQQIINTIDLVGLGLFAFIFSQSLVLSSRFSKALQTAEELSYELEQKVKDRTASIKDLLDNTGQGFLSFNQGYQIQKYTSKATRLFFNQKIEKKNVLELMFPDCQESTKETLDLVFDNPESLRVVKSLIPTELVRDQKIYKIDYHWIKGNEIQEGRIMMILSDITIERALENKLKTDQERNTIILKIAVDRHGFIDFQEGMKKLIHTILKSLSRPLNQINVNELFRGFHTIKSGMDSYGFFDIAQKARTVEAQLSEFRDGQKALDHNELQTINTMTLEIQLLLTEQLEKLSFLLPKELLEASKKNYYRIPESKISSVEAALKKNKVDYKSINDSVKALRKQPVRNILKKLANDMAEIAKKLNKTIDIKIEGEATEIVHAPLQQFFASLIHLGRNLVDHGIESQEIRSQNRKPENGQIKLIVNHSENRLHFFWVTMVPVLIPKKSVRWHWKKGSLIKLNLKRCRNWKSLN